MTKAIQVIYREATKDYLLPDGTISPVLDLDKIMKMAKGQTVDFITKRARVSNRDSLSTRRYNEKYFGRRSGRGERDKVDDVIEKLTKPPKPKHPEMAMATRRITIKRSSVNAR